MDGNCSFYIKDQYRLLSKTSDTGKLATLVTKILHRLNDYICKYKYRQVMFTFIAGLSVITNSGLCVLNMSFTKNNSYWAFGIFILLQWIGFSVMYMISEVSISLCLNTYRSSGILKLENDRIFPTYLDCS